MKKGAEQITSRYTEYVKPTSGDGYCLILRCCVLSCGNSLQITPHKCSTLYGTKQIELLTFYGRLCFRYFDIDWHPSSSLSFVLSTSV
jgi:hypothetical protein